MDFWFSVLNLSIFRFSKKSFWFDHDNVVLGFDTGINVCRSQIKTRLIWHFQYLISFELMFCDLVFLSNRLPRDLSVWSSLSNFLFAFCRSRILSFIFLLVTHPCRACQRVTHYPLVKWIVSVVWFIDMNAHTIGYLFCNSSTCEACGVTVTSYL